MKMFGMKLNLHILDSCLHEVAAMESLHDQEAFYILLLYGKVFYCLEIYCPLFCGKGTTDTLLLLSCFPIANMLELLTVSNHTQRSKK